MAGHDERAGSLVGRAPAADQDLALGVLAGGDGLDLVLRQDGPPAEHRQECLVDGGVERVDRPVAGRIGRPVLAANRERDAARRVAAVRRGDAPADDRDRRRDLRGALLDEGEQIRVGHFLLGVGQRDRLAVEHVERVALDVVAQLAQLALEPAPAGQLADRQLAARQPDRLRAS